MCVCWVSEATLAPPSHSSLQRLWWRLEGFSALWEGERLQRGNPSSSAVAMPGKSRQPNPPPVAAAEAELSNPAFTPWDSLQQDSGCVVLVVMGCPRQTSPLERRNNVSFRCHP